MCIMVRLITSVFIMSKIYKPYYSTRVSFLLDQMLPMLVHFINDAQCEFSWLWFSIKRKLIFRLSVRNFVYFKPFNCSFQQTGAMLFDIVYIYNIITIKIRLVTSKSTILFQFLFSHVFEVLFVDIKDINTYPKYYLEKVKKNIDRKQIFTIHLVCQRIIDIYHNNFPISFTWKIKIYINYLCNMLHISCNKNWPIFTFVNKRHCTKYFYFQYFTSLSNLFQNIIFIISNVMNEII